MCAHRAVATLTVVLASWSLALAPVAAARPDPGQDWQRGPGFSPEVAGPFSDAGAWGRTQEAYFGYLSAATTRRHLRSLTARQDAAEQRGRQLVAAQLAEFSAKDRLLSSAYGSYGGRDLAGYAQALTVQRRFVADRQPSLSLALPRGTVTVGDLKALAGPLEAFAANARGRVDQTQRTSSSAVDVLASAKLPGDAKAWDTNAFYAMRSAGQAACMNAVKERTAQHQRATAAAQRAAGKPDSAWDTVWSWLSGTLTDNEQAKTMSQQQPLPCTISPAVKSPPKAK